MFLISGGTGMVGNYLVRLLKDRNLDFYSPTRQELNLNDLNHLDSLLEKHKVKTFVHLAAETDVDLCERDPAHAYRVNSFATKRIAEACAAKGIDLIYISTSNVFGATGQYTYNELDLPCPVNYYGKSKLKGEEFIKETFKNFCVIRAAWMIGGGPDIDKKFVGKVLRQIKDGATNLNAVSDKIGSLTYAKHLAYFIIELAENKKYGTYHFSSKTPCTRYDVAKELVRAFKKDIDVKPSSSVNFPLSAPRPFSESINSVAIQQVSKLGDSTWEQLLHEYLREWEGAI